MTQERMDNGEYFMRRYGRMVEAQRLAQQRAYNNYTQAPWQLDHLTPRAWSGERPEPEDTTGLKLLEEFLAKRKREKRDGDKRQ